MSSAAPVSNRQQPRIAAVVIAKNEAINIRRCIASLDWCDEVVVIDDSSEDETVAWAEETGARVVAHKFESFAKQRNWANREAGIQSEWILHLDADEVSTPQFAQEIRSTINAASEDVVGYRTCRKTMFLEKWLKYSDGFPVWIMRIIRRGKAEFEDSGHGEVPVPTVEGKIGTISQPFLHYPFSHGLTNWATRHAKYADREARKELAEIQPISWKGLFTQREKRRATLRQLSRRLPARPLLRFLYQYLFKWGFLDGRAGWTFCWLMAYYEFQIVVRKRELALQVRDLTAKS